MPPPRSPFSLIQEDLWPDDWKILISCMLLNCTTRKQVEKVLPQLFFQWPTAKDMVAADPAALSIVISSLGFQNRRAASLIKMSKAYHNGLWSHAKELPGIGDYAAAAWEMFCRGSLPAAPPNDHALVAYYNWRKRHECLATLD